jgi:hypothetical protein
MTDLHTAQYLSKQTCAVNGVATAQPSMKKPSEKPMRLYNVRKALHNILTAKILDNRHISWNALMCYAALLQCPDFLGTT